MLQTDTLIMFCNISRWLELKSVALSSCFEILPNFVWLAGQERQL